LSDEAVLAAIAALRAELREVRGLLERLRQPMGLGRLDRAVLDAIGECFARCTFAARDAIGDGRLTDLLRSAGLMNTNALGRRFERYRRLGYLSRVQRGAQGWIYELVDVD
jgi:hypothetical protein